MGTPFADNIHGLAALYAADNNWSLVIPTRGSPSPIVIPSDDGEPHHIPNFAKTYLQSSLSGQLAQQIWIDPVTVPVYRPRAGADPADPTRWFLIISVGTGDNNQSGENRLGHAWRIQYSPATTDTPPVAEKLHVDYLGLFGGVTADNVAVALSAQYPGGTPSGDGDNLLVQATFTATNTLIQNSDQPVQFAGQLQGQLQQVPSSGASTIGGGVLGFQLAGGPSVNQRTPPPPLFFLSYNAVLSIQDAPAAPAPSPT
jgi:hypothetical protein